MRTQVLRFVSTTVLDLTSAKRERAGRGIADDRLSVPRGDAQSQHNTPRRSARRVPTLTLAAFAIGALLFSSCQVGIASHWPLPRLGPDSTAYNPSESTISPPNVSGVHMTPRWFGHTRRQQLRPNAVGPPTPVAAPTTVPPTTVPPSTTTTTAPMRALQPIPVVVPAPTPPTTTTTNPGWNCTVGVEYLELHQAPGFTDVCPASLPLGQAALTCINIVPACPGEKVIEISDPTCAAAYQNEASNSWALQGLSTAPIDPFGPCFIH